MLCLLAFLFACKRGIECRMYLQLKRSFFLGHLVAVVAETVLATKEYRGKNEHRIVS